jgi:tRNA pseudouridine55 synthase
VPRRGRRESLLDGFLVVDKEAGMTSHDVVGILRRQLDERRIGHAGTLDPDATGVLVVAIGRATRLMRFVSGADKAYIGNLVLGTSTSTLDASGEVTGRFDMAHVTLDDVREVALSFTGRIEQIPPMVSAIKIDGRRLYELAREGTEVERPSRHVEITRLDVEATDRPQVFQIMVECSAGTYIRSLAADLGAALGGGAHLQGLRRTRVGSFDLSQAIDARAAKPEDLRPALSLLSDLPQLRISDDIVQSVLHGRSLEQSLTTTDEVGPWVLVARSDELIAVYERDGETELKPILVYAASSTGDDAATRGA